MNDNYEELLKRLSIIEEEVDSIKTNIVGLRWTVRCTCPNPAIEQQDPLCGRHSIEAFINKQGWTNLFAK